MVILPVPPLAAPASQLPTLFMAPSAVPDERYPGCGTDPAAADGARDGEGGGDGLLDDKNSVDDDGRHAGGA